MAKNQENTYKRLADYYASGDVPWDEPLPPPEVLNLIPTLQPGRALDLGCGYGRAAIYMASLGWQVDAVDFIPEAIEEASGRARQAGVDVRFYVAQVTSLDFLGGPYDFALDVGCGHTLNESELRQYRDQLHRLLRPGGIFLFFARLSDENLPEDESSTAGEESDSPSGLAVLTITSVFDDGFEMEWYERGLTEMD
ncbi:MAG: class I SAM-dependent methyltransferase, partial [Chloroflexota bacterium]